MTQGSSIVLVTGASRGIGLAITQSLLKQGASVLGVGRSTLESLPALQQLASEYPDRFAYCVADLSVQGSAKTAIDTCVARFGSIHSLVHNAAITAMTRIADSKMSEWRSVMEVNLFAGIELVQLALPMLRNGGPSGNGRILIVSSGAARRALQGLSPYCVSKAAAHMLVSGLAVEEPSVTSISVMPGVVDTDMQTDTRANGKAALGDEAYSMFVGFKEKGMLLDPAVPGSAIAELALTAPHSLSGEFINWDFKPAPPAAAE